MVLEDHNLREDVLDATDHILSIMLGQVLWLGGEQVLLRAENVLQGLLFFELLQESRLGRLRNGLRNSDAGSGNWLDFFLLSNLLFFGLLFSLCSNHLGRVNTNEVIRLQNGLGVLLQVRLEGIDVDVVLWLEDKVPQVS